MPRSSPRRPCWSPCRSPPGSAACGRRTGRCGRRAGRPVCSSRILALMPARDLERVFAVGHQDHAAGDLVAVFLEDASAEAGPERDVGDLGQPDRAPARRAARPRSPGRASARSGSKLSSPGLVEAPSRPTPRTTYSAFPLWMTWPPDGGVRRRHGLDHVVERHAESPQPVGVGDDLVLDRETRRRSKHRPLPATEPSCGRTYQSWIARSRPRSNPPPSTVYQKIWPVAAASGVSSGLRSARELRSAPAPAARPRAGVLRRGRPRPRRSR